MKLQRASRKQKSVQKERAHEVGRLFSCDLVDFIAWQKWSSPLPC